MNSSVDYMIYYKEKEIIRLSLIAKLPPRVS